MQNGSLMLFPVFPCTVGISFAFHLRKLDMGQVEKSPVATVSFSDIRVPFSASESGSLLKYTNQS
jgi:hypothetical protein